MDGAATTLPSAADWLINATTARLALDHRDGGLLQITHLRAVPDPDGRSEVVTVELKSGEGLVAPTSFPSRRGADRGDVDTNRLLLLSLDEAHASDLETWADRTFDTDLVGDALGAVAQVQEDRAYGCVIVHAPRTKVRDALTACRALRPLTKAAIVFASDDAIRSTDRIQLLEAGADDCLSGGIDFRELALRVRQAMASGARPVVPRAEATELTPVVPEGWDGGSVDRELFDTETRRRAESPELAFFCVLTIFADSLPSSETARIVADLVRSDEGDLVCDDGDRCLALLQGAREGQVEGFVKRLRATLGKAVGSKKGVSIEVLGHPADEEAIVEVLGTSIVSRG